MDVPAPEPQDQPVGPYTVERYLRLVDEGVLEPDDRVELLEGWRWRPRTSRTRRVSPE